MPNLAIFGGPPEIATPGPHYIWPRITSQVEKAVIGQLHNSISIYDRSGVFFEFEEAFRSQIGREFGLVTNSGTSAIFSIFEGLDLRPGDELIVPAYTFFATISPLSYFGAFIYQVDADENGNMAPELVEKYITRRTRAIVLTHMWGQPCRMAAVMDVANRHSLPVIEDCSHAHGAIENNQPVGSRGHAAAWSLQGQKNVTGGEGGILLTDDRLLFERALLVGHYNKRARQQIDPLSPNMEFAVTGFGLKLRAHPLAIAIALQQFGCLQGWLANKQKVAKRFCDALNPYPFISLPQTEGTVPAWYAFVFHYHEEQSEVPIDVFVRALHAEGLAEVDRPTSTRCIGSYPLFTRTQHALPRLYSRHMLLNDEEPQPAARRFVDTAIKLPVWCFEDETTWVDSYIAGLTKVCDLIARRPTAFADV